MKTLNRDQFAEFIFSQNKKIKAYNFDLFHDIAQIVNFSYNHKNYRDDNNHLITNKPVSKIYYFYVREFGSWLVEISNSELIHSIEKSSPYINKYKITIIANCDYLFNTEFAIIEEM